MGAHSTTDSSPSGGRVPPGWHVPSRNSFPRRGPTGNIHQSKPVHLHIRHGPDTACCKDAAHVAVRIEEYKNMSTEHTHKRTQGVQTPEKMQDMIFLDNYDQDPPSNDQDRALNYSDRFLGSATQEQWNMLEKIVRDVRKDKPDGCGQFTLALLRKIESGKVFPKFSASEHLKAIAKI